jgi:hypothetical protein
MADMQKITNSSSRNLRLWRIAAEAKTSCAVSSPSVPDPYVPGLRGEGDGEPVRRFCARHLQHVIPARHQDPSHDFPPI